MNAETALCLTNAADDRGHMTTRTTGPRRASTETKSAHKTTELIVYVLGVAGVLIAAALVADASFESFRVSEKGAVSKNRGLAFLARTTRSVFRGWRVRCNSYARRDKVRSWATWKRSRKR